MNMKVYQCVRRHILIHLFVFSKYLIISVRLKLKKRFDVLGKTLRHLDQNVEAF